MGTSQVKATLCPNCSYEHVIIPMFKQKKDQYFCLLCRTTYEKRVNGINQISIKNNKSGSVLWHG